jgi:hypothetical protein
VKWRKAKAETVLRKWNDPGASGMIFFEPNRKSTQGNVPFQSLQSFPGPMESLPAYRHTVSLPDLPGSLQAIIVELTFVSRLSNPNSKSDIGRPHFPCPNWRGFCRFPTDLRLIRQPFLSPSHQPRLLSDQITHTSTTYISCFRPAE